MTAKANEPLLVRVSYLRPNAEGKVMFDVTGATVNLVAVGEAGEATFLCLVRNR